MKWNTTEPELYVHFALTRSDSDRADLEQMQVEITAAAKRAFASFYEFDCEVDVVVSEGSVKIRVKLTPKTIGKILGAYVLAHAALDYFAKDVRWVQTQLRDHILSSPRIEHVVSARRRVGVIGKLDEALHDYVAGRISQGECQERIMKYLELIAASEHKEEYISALVGYLDSKYRNVVGPNTPIQFPWDDLEHRLEALPPRRRKHLIETSNKTNGR